MRAIFFVFVFCVLHIGTCFAIEKKSLHHDIIANPYAYLDAFRAAEIADNPLPLTKPPRKIPVATVRDIHIDTCLYSDAFHYGSIADRPQDFRLALQVIIQNIDRLINDLKRSNYPSSIWEQHVEKLMHSQIDAYGEWYHSGRELNQSIIRKRSDASVISLVRSLEHFAKLHKAPQIIYDTSEAPCGGDFIGYVRLRTTPRGGNIRVIREFDYELCKKVGVNPMSSECDSWISVTQNTELPEGRYRYHIKWSSNDEECGLGSFQQKTTSETPQLLTVAHSGSRCSL